ncbi:hypothetical protein NIES2107_11060 [Nostoc carneum NIES-2107]|nr:hypothetical protein NIES2107_11060 [Nostoc carneum NIES-2107]
MPITPTYPGVYAEKISSGVQTITRVSASVTILWVRQNEGQLIK